MERGTILFNKQKIHIIDEIPQNNNFYYITDNSYKTYLIDKSNRIIYTEYKDGSLRDATIYIKMLKYKKRIYDNLLEDIENNISILTSYLSKNINNMSKRDLDLMINELLCLYKKKNCYFLKIYRICGDLKSNHYNKNIYTKYKIL